MVLMRDVPLAVVSGRFRIRDTLAFLAPDCE